MFIQTRSLLAFVAVVTVGLYALVSYIRNDLSLNCLYNQRLTRDRIIPWQPLKQEKAQGTLSEGVVAKTSSNVPNRRRSPFVKKRNTKHKKCDRVKHILFLKTHKTGGSTITNILNRFGDKWNLTFALPKQKHLFTFLWPTRFRLSYTAPLYKFDINILCNHARYNRKPMHWLFPKNKAKYITILRNPLNQYESVFNFMHFANPLGFGRETDPLGTFLKYPPSFRETHPLMKKTLALHLLRNPMLFDLGLDFRYFQNRTAIEDYISFIGREFDLVMIMEYFDESLVLLKQLLCWSYEDILYFKLNERQDKQKRKSLDKTVQENIMSWNNADRLLYNHFNKTLWRKIKAQGKTFTRELAIFRGINERISKKCLQKGDYLDEAYTGVYVKGYSLRTDIPSSLKSRCENMKKNEISYVKYFRKRSSDMIMNIEEPSEYLDDPLNDWDTANDYEHTPVMSGYGSGAPEESGSNEKS